MTVSPASGYTVKALSPVPDAAMHRPVHLRRLILAFAYATLWSFAAIACDLPVFRYALERWPVTPYRLLIFHRGPLTSDQQAQFDAIKSAAADANLLLEPFDLSTEIDVGLRAIFKAHQGDAPLAVLRFPGTAPQAPSAWSGPLSQDAFLPVMDSPVRRRIASLLLAGESIVWVLLESGEPARDRAAAGLLQQTLGRLELSLNLRMPTSAPADVTGAGLSQKLHFSVLRIASDDQREAAFRSMLLHIQPDGQAPDPPAVVPVFGRGRALGTLAGKDLNDQGIASIAEFLCGNCTCGELTVGQDLLICANWGPFLNYAQTETPATPEADPPQRRWSTAPWVFLAAIAAVVAIVIIFRTVVAWSGRRQSERL